MEPSSPRKKKSKHKKKGSAPPLDISNAAPPAGPTSATPSVEIVDSGVPPPSSSSHPPPKPLIKRAHSPSYLKRTISSIVRGTLYPLAFSSLPYIILILAIWWMTSWFHTSLHRLLAPVYNLPAQLSPYIPRLHFPSSTPSPYRILAKSASPFVAIYCSTIGVGCSGKKNQRQRNHIGGITRTVRVQALQAMDLFDSVLQLGGPEGGSSSLHHVALWELSTAVKHTSAIESRAFLGDQLKELGDLTRDVKDEVIRLNSQGISSFTWIVQQFTRLEEILERESAPGGSKVSDATLEGLLDSLFEKISDDLSSLLKSLDKAIPLADEASVIGGRVSDGLSSEYARLQKESEDTPVWRALVDRQGWKGKQLRRDLELSKDSVDWVKDVRFGLESVRHSFVEYQANVGGFKAGVVGYHLAGHGLSASDEISSLKTVMKDFRSTLDEVKVARRSGIPRKQTLGEGSTPKESGKL